MKCKSVCVCVCVCVGPAMDHSRGVSGVLVHVLSDQVSEADEQLGGLGDSVIWPRCEVEVTHWTGLCCFYLKDEHTHKLKIVAAEKSTSTDSWKCI